MTSYARLVVNATGSVNPIIIASLIASGLATTGIIVNPIEDVVCASSSFQQISCVCDVIPSANSTAAELVHSHRTHSNRNALAALLVTSFGQRAQLTPSSHTEPAMFDRAIEAPPIGHAIDGPGFADAAVVAI